MINDHIARIQTREQVRSYLQAILTTNKMARFLSAIEHLQFTTYTSEAPAPWYSVFGLNILSQTGNTE